MNCPRCNTALKSGTYETAPTMLCISCSGILVKQHNLMSMLARLSTDLASIVDINTPILLVPDKGPIKLCPDCRGNTEYYGYMEGRNVMLDFCTHCNWLWIEAAELQEMAKIYTQFQKVKAHIDYTHGYRNSDIVSIHMLVEAVSKAFLTRFVFL